ncbi:NAD(P)-binding protein [Neofusicoccum parvum]|uniref:NAD(P)-binding protein n=2 Tax=Neofusicoccum parvum TaxID=310453 RepID=A0ACB5SFY7_9PEZI|nr:putative myo-inositol 2-dehydrogenase protein [Neofusicoccum parvum UCRNP2]GME39078.1 NAD(P)-binding protein [Neofusicoccum parvum]GME52708.1 NAD(P)-binding protein [Neofusicoccum parvum]
MPPPQVLRVGIIGCGEIAQVAHIPTLSFLSSLFTITYLCDVSRKSLDFCRSRVAGGRSVATTARAEDLCSSADVDAVVVCNSDAFHVPHALLALQNNKHVLVEKPLALTYRDIDALAAAEQASSGTVFVGYMRRYAPAFSAAIGELGGVDKIQYVRVRDIIGPNSVFVDQSGTFPRRFADFPEDASKELKDRTEALLEHAVGEDCGVEVSASSKQMMFILGALGTHDLSAMRELIGMPQKVLGAYPHYPIWSVLFQYDGFAVTYESGLNSVPVFDAHIEIYSADKIVRINYDSPYVKGLPTTMTVRERIGSDGYQERTLRTTYEDLYTKEFKEWHSCVTSGRTPKTSIEDARKDLDIFNMIMKAGFA